ncbi:unnamed protein product, partial [Symbiodinium sp. KB8]
GGRGRGFAPEPTSAWPGVAEPRVRASAAASRAQQCESLPREPLSRLPRAEHIPQLSGLTGLGSAKAEMEAPHTESSDEATPTEAESDGQSFLLVTSGEFCEGTARSRATWRGKPHVPVVGAAGWTRMPSGTCTGDMDGTGRTRGMKA